MEPERRTRKGQSLVEFTLLLPILLLILGGLVEFGFWMLQYSHLIQATRNAARFALDNDYTYTDPRCSPVRTPACTKDDVCPLDFYCKTALIALDNLAKYTPSITLDAASDDIVVSAFTLSEGQFVTHRYPEENGDNGWSYFGNHTSRFTTADVEEMLRREGIEENTNAGYVLVETFYNYHQLLRLPWLTAFVPDPIPLYTYTFMPLYSAAPEPTQASP